MNDNEHINFVLNNAVRNDNYDVIKEQLSLKERVKIMYGNSDDFLSLKFRASDIYLNLFDDNEAAILYTTYTGIKQRNILICNLSDESKIKELSNYTGDIVFLLSSFKDEKLKMEFFEKIFVGDRIDSSSVIGILESFNYRMDILDKIIERVKVGDKDIINSFSVQTIISKFNGDQKMEVLDKFIDLAETSNKKIIAMYCVVDIIKSFSNDKKMDVLEKFIILNQKKNGSLLDIYQIKSILEIMDDELKLTCLDIFLKNGLITEKDKYSVESIFKIFPDDSKPEVLDFFYKYDKERKLVDSYVISKIIMTYSEDKRLGKFKELVLGSDDYSDFQVINYFDDLDFRFTALNFEIQFVLSVVKDEKLKDEFYKKLERYLNWYMDHNRKFPNGDKVYSDLISLYADLKNVNEDNLVKFIGRFGYVSLMYLDSENVRNAINLDADKFQLFLSIFDKNNVNLDNDVLNTICNSILQREFIFENRDDYSIFSTIDTLLKKGDSQSLEIVKDNILMMSEVVNIHKILKKYDLSLDEFLRKFLDGNDGMLDILHQITNQYIMKKREKYVKGRLTNINDELDLNKKYERNFIKKKYIATTSRSEIGRALRFDIDKKILTPIQLELLESWWSVGGILDSVIDYKKSPNDHPLNPEYKKYLKPFDELLNILYENDKLKDPTNDPNAKYVYYPKNVDSEYLLGIITELDIGQIDKFLLSDRDLLQKLISLFSKYKMLGWNKTFVALEDKADFTFDESTISGIIGYFYKIYPELKDDSAGVSLTKLISYGNCYSSSSKKYSLLFGQDDFKLLAANSGKNKASMPRYKRLKLATSHIINMYQKTKVSIPSFDGNITLSNGKVINAVVGNATNMRNMTMGERTNSCLRVGGAFYDLFKFCLNDENGFHICYNDPMTDKFISRVSGIRNGNTLFLNELRTSELATYSDDDCVEVTRKIAKMLVDKTRDSEYPIENVVITSDYAMEPYASEKQSLELQDRDQALYGLHHNLDNEGKAIVLASSKDDNGLVEIKLGKEFVEHYSIQRDKIREYNGRDSAIQRMIQLQMIDKLLKGIPLDEIDVDLDFDVVKCISGEDFYISIDSMGNIQEFVLEKSKNKTKAFDEMILVLNRLMSNLDDQKERGIGK